MPFRRLGQDQAAMSAQVDRGGVGDIRPRPRQDFWHFFQGPTRHDLLGKGGALDIDVGMEHIAQTGQGLKEGALNGGIDRGLGVAIIVNRALVHIDRDKAVGGELAFVEIAFGNIHLIVLSIAGESPFGAAKAGVA